MEIQVHTLGEPNGKLKDLPDNGGTTMWVETLTFCPNNVFHMVTGSTRRIYCSECKVWWWRKGYGGV